MQNRMNDELVATRAQLFDHELSVTDKAKDFSEATRERLDRSRQAVERYVASHPAICLAATAGLGITVGWWIKRK